MRAGVARIDITPTESIWMVGMLRAHPRHALSWQWTSWGCRQN
jgi:hypothetical protein